MTDDAPKPRAVPLPASEENPERVRCQKCGATRKVRPHEYHVQIGWQPRCLPCRVPMRTVNRENRHAL